MKKLLGVSTAIAAVIGMGGIALAVETPPEKPSGEASQQAPAGDPPAKPDGEAPSGEAPDGAPGGAPSGAPGGQGTSAAEATSKYSGAQTLSSDVTLENTTFESSTGGQNALLAKNGATVTISGATITKSGDLDEEYADFYGNNAAVLAYDEAVIGISDSTITTSGSHANALFSYDDGEIDAEDVKITTTGNNSGGIMVTGGGILTATNLEVETSGNSSAPIRSDRGGGILSVVGGKYTSNGVGSPAVYSTANVSVMSAELNSNKSEGVVVEGANSVKLEESVLTANNTELNGNSETYKTVFIYQSMSGDADAGKGTFTAIDSEINTKHGDTFFVTNTDATILLLNTKITNEDSDGVFLRAQAGKWGNSGENGGNVTLDFQDGQVAEGDIVLDDISTLKFELSEKSKFTGAINHDNKAKSVKLVLTSDSEIWLTGDSYVTEFVNTSADNSNIHGNGYKLYVNGEAVEINQEEAPKGLPAWAWAVCGVVVVVLVGAVLAFLKKNNGKKKRAQAKTSSPNQ